MNSSTHSESALLSNVSPTQSMSKVKHRDNKENKLQRFGGAFMNGGTLVFGKIKSLWSHSNTDIGLNILAESDRCQKSKSAPALGLEFRIIFVFFAVLMFGLFPVLHEFSTLRFPILHECFSISKSELTNRFLHLPDRRRMRNSDQIKHCHEVEDYQR
jgi:hypothetical protein